MSVDKVDTVDIMDLAAGPSTVSTESTKSTSRGKEWQSLMALDILPPFMKQRQDNKGLIPTHGEYRNLKSFQLSEVIYDVTVRFCRKFVNPRSRTYDQMEQAARSGRQNIAEGSMASATSKKTEIKLTNVAKASQEELRLDFEDFLRQRNLPVWDRNDPRRVDLIARRPRTADDVARWAMDVKTGRCPGNASTQSTASTPSYAEILANGALALIAVTCSLLDRQIKAQAKAFEEEGGFTERLYRRRTQRRDARE